MIAELRQHFKQMRARLAPPVSAPTPSPVVPPVPLPLVRPALSVLATPGYELPAQIAACPVTRTYLDLIGGLDWATFPERPTTRPQGGPWPGPAQTRRAPFAAAFLVRLQEGHPSMAKLRRFLADHPALVWVLGFPLAPDPSSPWGFDPQASLPPPRQFSRVLRALPNDALQFLLDGAVTLVAAQLPEGVTLGEVISGDTKHILAWVKENNPKAFIKKGRYDPAHQPEGDPDCKLGVKKRRNRSPQEAEDLAENQPLPQPTPTAEGLPASHLKADGRDELYWGYASGIIVTKLPGFGELVLAERTRPFNEADITYFFPLMHQVERRLGRRPKWGAFDAAFDAFYTYDYFHQVGGFAAIPYTARGGKEKRSFTPDGLPRCAAGLAMPLKRTYWCQTTTVAHERGCYACPLLHPTPSGEGCPINDPHWPRGGCETKLATSPGARVRVELDRESETFTAIFDQRTASERINSQALALGIERPKLRNQASIANLNTLIYVLIDLRLVARVRQSRKVAGAALTN
jgi:hypothetical protein